MFGDYRKKRNEKLKLMERYQDSYTDRGFYITKKRRKKMKKIAQDPYLRTKKGALNSDVWNSKIGRKLLNSKKMN